MSDKFAFSLQELMHALIDRCEIDVDTITSAILHKSEVDEEDVFVL